MLNTSLNGRTVLRYGAAASALFLLASCIADPNLHGHSDQDDLINAYRAQAERYAAQQAQAAADSIRLLDVNTDSEMGDVLLSVDLSQADLRTVLTKILDIPHLQYTSEAVSLSGTVSARCKDQPIVEGMNVIWANSGVYVEDDNGILTFKAGLADKDSGVSDDATFESVTGFTSSEVPIKHLASADVVTLIGELFPFAEFSDDDGLTASSIAETNSVYLVLSLIHISEPTRPY